MASRCLRPTDLVDFWLLPWSAPLRDACCWIALLGALLAFLVTSRGAQQRIAHA